jgi:hypothetical protein
MRGDHRRVPQAGPELRVAERSGERQVWTAAARAIARSEKHEPRLPTDRSRTRPERRPWNSTSAARIGGRAFGFGRAETRLVFALSLPQMAATLASAVVAHDTLNP